MGTAAAAASNISDTNKFAYGANTGWIDARGNGTNGAVLGEYACSGFMYGANIGWINLGDGTPTNGVRYNNSAADDFGVNHDSGRLRGYAYCANVGWVCFETNGNPRVNLLTGALDGYAYGANIGWISLSNAFAYVQANNLQPGADGDGDGIPDAWEIDQVGTTNVLAGGNADHDGDSVTDKAEYLGDTDPDNFGDNLRVTNLGVSNAVQATIAWPSRQSRLYRVEHAIAITNDAAWLDSGFGVFAPDGTNTVRTIGHGDTAQQFYRVEGVLPLQP